MIVLQSEIIASMQAVCERVEYLTVEAAKTRGTLFAFREPMWATWPLARFGESRAFRLIAST